MNPTSTTNTGITPRLLTSGSKYQTWLDCPRKRWLAYEDNNGSGRGWQRKSMDIALGTGTWCHRTLSGGQWEVADGQVMSRGLWQSENASEAILMAKEGYLREARQRGLELDLQLDGSVDAERFVERTIQEQAVLIEAFGWSFARVRLPRLLDEYELVCSEQEELALLSGDVGLQARCDAVLRRRSDGLLFVYNLKTASDTGKKWSEHYEVDQQMVTETLAIERRLGEKVYGVIVDGFEKGPRVNVWYDNLKECRDNRPEGEKWQAHRSRLLYGYKCEPSAAIPGSKTMYDYEGTTRKGWGKFAVWEEDFAGLHDPRLSASTTSIEYWINWLPQEQVEAQFTTLPPIVVGDRRQANKVRQIVAVEREIAKRVTDVEDLYVTSDLDTEFPQNERSCTWPKKCEFYRLCWESGGSPGERGYEPREHNHPQLENGE